MTYDSVDGYVLYTPGAGNCTGAAGRGYVWTFTAGVWTERPSAAPTVDYAALATDPRDGYVVLFGGINGSCGGCNATWAYAGGNWTNLGISAPTARWGATAAWDPTANAVVLFGGNRFAGLSGVTNETWTFAAGHWTQVASPSSPPARAFATMAVDRAGGLEMFGGQNGTALRNDSWTFSAGTWTASRTGPTPPAGRWSSIFLNVSGGSVFLVGVPSISYLTGPTSVVPADQWAFNGSRWSNTTPSRPPAVDSNVALTYDTADGYVLLFGAVEHYASPSTFTTVTWSYRAGVWTNLTPARSPSARTGEGFAYDAADHYVVLFGGSSFGSCSTNLNLSVCADTWEFLAGQWTRLTPRASPSNRTGTAFVYDGGDGYVLLYGGQCPGVGNAPRFCDDTWKFSAGNWTNITSSSGAPPGGAFPSAGYDSSAGYVLLYDEYMDGAGATNPITWKFQGGKWSNLTLSVGAQPPSGFAFGLVDDPQHGGVLWFGSENGGVGSGLPGAFDATWEFVGGVWQNLSAAPNPRVVDQAVAADGSSGPLLVGGTFGSSPPSPPFPAGVNPVFTWANITGGPPVITSFAAVPPATDVGNRTDFYVAVAGGTAPLSFTYSGLPAGCATANSSTLPCTPVVPGTFNVTVTVRDATGNRTSAGTELVVNPAPTITAFTATPTAVSIGGRTVLSVNASYGSPPWIYRFSGLPSGCSSQSVPLLPCYPTATGNFTVRVQVVDQFNATASASATLVVTAAGGPGHPRVSSFSAVPSAFVLGNSTNLTVVAAGAAPLTYAYSGLPGGCLSNNTTALACRPTSAGIATVTVVVTDRHHNATSVSTNVMVFPVGGGAGLTVSAFSAAPATFVVGGSTTLEVVAAGGVGPIGYSYLGLPPGCRSQNLSLLPCQPTANGTFEVTVRVADSARHVASVRSTLDVLGSAPGPGPLIKGFVASPARVVLGGSLTLIVAIAGGALPLRYAYTGLPSGCSTQNASVLTCTPTAVGGFSPIVVVTDAQGRMANTSTSVVVVPTQPSPGQPGSGALGWAALLPYLGVFALATVGTALLFGAAARREAEQRRGRELVRELESTRREPLDLDEGD